MANILITGARAPATLDLVRSFAKDGHSVYVIDCINYALAKYTNHITQFLKVHSPRFHPLKFIDDLNKIIIDKNIDKIIPTCEEVFYLAKFKHLIHRSADLFLDDFNKLYSLHNKFDFLATLPINPIIAPKTLMLNKDNLNKIIQNREHYVVKAIFSRFATKTYIKPSVAILHNIALHENEWIAQEYIKGTEYSTYSIAIKGKLTAHVTYHSLYRAGKGAGIYFENIDIPIIENFVKRYVEYNNYTGQIGFDFIMTDTDAVYVLECNPRSTSGLHFLSSTPQFTDAFFDSNVYIKNKNKTRKMLLIPMIFYSFQYILNFKKLPNWLNDFMAASDVVYTKDDSRPFYMQIYNIFCILITSFFYLKNPLTITTSDIEYNGQ